MKKGETRNPHGRPKGTKSTKAMVRKVLPQKMAIREKGATRKVTLFQALLLKEVEIAFAGNWRVSKTVLELGRWSLPEEIGLLISAESWPGRWDNFHRDLTHV